MKLTKLTQLTEQIFITGRASRVMDKEKTLGEWDVSPSGRKG